MSWPEPEPFDVLLILHTAAGRLAAVERERDELRAEVQHLAASRQRFVERLRDIRREIPGVPLTAVAGAVAEFRDRAGAAEARLEAVKALAEEWEADDQEHLNTFGQHLACSLAVPAERLLAALSVAPQPQPADENACRNCGVDNPVWFAPNEVWNAVMGYHRGFLCPSCFIVRAEASGLRPTAWILAPEEQQ